jgi:hypothetical protein
MEPDRLERFQLLVQEYIGEQDRLIDPDDDLADLGLDVLDVIEICLRYQDRHGEEVPLPTCSCEGVVTLRRLADGGVPLAAVW